MKTRNFAQCLEIGQTWEAEIEAWMPRYFATKQPGYRFVSTKDVYRDEDGDQFPDYTIYTPKGEYYFLDAKQRHAYRHSGYPPSFGFDKRYYQSYLNIAKKHSTKVFVAFRDKRLDAAHLYMLNVDQPPDFTWDYGPNGHGEPICHRWHVDSLKKMTL